MPPKSGKAKKELLKGKKEERKTSGRGAGFSSVVCDWGSTAVNSAPPAGSKAAEDLANAEKQGPTWTGTQLSGSGAETTTRGESWAPRRAGGFGSRGGRAGGAPGLLVQAPRNKLSTFFQRENDHDVQQRKLDASRPLERTAHTAQDAWAHITPRPLPWPLPLVDGAFVPVIPIPKRPPWRRDMTQGELEKQEQAMFAKWTERIFAEHGRSSLNHFEHNLEVWRQLWRAVERSDLAVFVVDARLPWFHFQQAMWDYVTKDMGREAIVCINKADLVHPHVTHLWLQYFKKQLPGVQVVAFYVPKSTSRSVGQPCKQDFLEALAKCTVTRGGVKVRAADFMGDLINTGPAGSQAHSAAAAQAAAESAGKQRVKAEGGDDEEEEEGDGLALLCGEGGKAEAEAAAAAEEEEEEFAQGPPSSRKENAFITVCLVGDPNMGKSSLMNSVFGRKVVSSSSTPGHTKHIQTYFLNKGMCICDAPGIVCPRLNIPRELQVIFGTFRIAQVREPYSIIRYAAERCWPPLEEVYDLLSHRDEEDQGTRWSPWNICEAFARKKSFLTKGGRPETHRAGLMLLKDLSLAIRMKVVLSFLPPGASPPPPPHTSSSTSHTSSSNSSAANQQEDVLPVWAPTGGEPPSMPHATFRWEHGEEEDEDTEDELAEMEEDTDEDEEESVEEDSDEEDALLVAQGNGNKGRGGGGGGMFALLSVEGEE